MAAKKAKKAAAKASAGSSALEFARSYIRRKPAAPFAEIRDAAEKKGITLYAISFGRAQALEGIVKTRSYGAAKKAKAEAATKPKRGPGRPKGSKNKPKPGAPVKRGPGRPKGSKNAAPAAAGLDSIEGLVTTLQALQSERDEAVNAIAQIREILDSIG